MCGGGPCLWDDGYHKWSVAIDLLGEVEKVFAWIGSKEVLPGIAVDAPGVVAWRYKGERDLFGVCDSMLCKDLFIESNYYSVDERFELTGEKGVIWVMKCTADMLKVPAVMMYKDGKLTKYDDMRQDWGDSFHDSTHHFIDCIKNDTEPHPDRRARARGPEFRPGHDALGPREPRGLPERARIGVRPLSLHEQHELTLPTRRPLQMLVYVTGVTNATKVV